ncbi:MAG: tetratricopeptide repeat protein [Gemmatimonadaceae bacterium]
MDRSSLISDLERQFSENPRRVFARLANEYRKAGDSDRAIEMCRAHIPQQPGYISGHIVLGQALFDRGEMDEARQTFETALALDPENLIALRQMGDIARQRGENGVAEGWYQRLLDVDPQNEEISGLVASMSPPPSSGAPSAPVSAADPMVNWGQVQTSAPSGAGPGVLTRTEDFPEHEFPDTFPATEDTELTSSEKAGGEESKKVDNDTELLDWGISPEGSAHDSGPGFAFESASPSLEETAASDSSMWSEKLALEDDGIAPAAIAPALLDVFEMPIAGRDDGVDVEPPIAEPLEAASQAAREAPSSYSYDPVLGRTFDEIVPPSEETPAAFVTETMAELYLQQGFREEALSVYRKLAEQNPGDEELRARVAHLEQGKGETVRAIVQEDRSTESVERSEEPRTVRSFLSALAARRPARPHTSNPGERSEAGAVQVQSDSGNASDPLGFFGDTPAPAEDEKAADRLARAYSGKDLEQEGEALGLPSRTASHGLSLDDVFRGAESRAEKTASAGGFSFDEFFNDASDAKLARGSEEGANAGSRGRQETGKPDESDLEAFNAWLEGLKK